MTMNNNLKLFPHSHFRRIDYLLIILLVSWTSSTQADSIELLQKNASIAYEKMMMQRDPPMISKDAAFAPRKLATAK